MYREHQAAESVGEACLEAATASRSFLSVIIGTKDFEPAGKEIVFRDTRVLWCQRSLWGRCERLTTRPQPGKCGSVGCVSPVLYVPCGRN